MPKPKPSPRSSVVHFFEPGNVEDLGAGILKLYQDRSRREALGRHSERFHQQYNWANLSLEYAALIDRLNQRQQDQPDSHLTASNVLI